MIASLAFSLAFFITVIINAQHTPEVCFYPAWSTHADFSNCWKNVPFKVMVLLVLPGYGIFALVVWIRHRTKKSKKM